MALRTEGAVRGGVRGRRLWPRRRNYAKVRRENDTSGMASISVSGLHAKHACIATGAESGSDGGMAFTFVEGTLVRALREGHWLLLDEINLAAPEVSSHSYCHDDSHGQLAAPP